MKPRLLHRQQQEHQQYNRYQNQESTVVIGNMTVGGTIAKVEEFANVLQVCVDTGAKRVLIPAASVMDLQTVPPDLLVKVQPVFYSDPVDAVYKALGVN